MTVTAGVITRSIIGESRDHDHRRDEGRADRLGEIEQQIQVAISGTAGTTITWAEIDITFDVEFIDATSQRYSNMAEPVFQPAGAKITSDGGPVIVHSCVRSYATDDRGVIVGATVAIGAMSGTSYPIVYAGNVSLVWQSFGSLPNEPADPDFTP